jgi:isopenicillin N synthase-like dioxygenase
VEHVDPGFITVLGKANVNGLEFLDSDNNWVELEPLMKENDVIVLIGETFQRLSDGKYKGALHRVGRGDRSRYNLALEVRPKIPIYHAWNTLKSNKSLGS